jgi:hypothetical protein
MSNGDEFCCGCVCTAQHTHKGSFLNRILERLSVVSAGAVNEYVGVGDAGTTMRTLHVVHILALG